VPLGDNFEESLKIHVPVYQ